MKKNKTLITTAAALLLLASAQSCSDDLLSQQDASRQGLRFSVKTQPWEGGVFAATRGQVPDGVPVDLLPCVSTNPDYDFVLEAMEGAPVEITKSLQSGERATRGTMKTTMGDGDHFKISAFQFGGDYSDHVYFDNKETSYDMTDGSGTWWKFTQTGTWNNWPGVEYVARFYAWWPTSYSMAPATKTIDYTVNSNVALQQDLLYDVTEPLNIGVDGQVDLSFKHALTAIRFKGGSDFDMNIKSITLKNFHNQGTFNLETKSWALTEDYADFTLNLYRKRENGVWKTSDDGTVWTDMGDANPVLNDGDLTLFMLPQDLGVNADGSQKEIVITLSDNTTLSTVFSSGTWAAGSTVTYTLQMGGTKSALSVSSPSGSYDEVVKTLTITSWRYVSENGKPVKKIQPWIVKSWTPNGETTVPTTAEDFRGFSSTPDGPNDWNSAGANVTTNSATFTYTAKVWCKALPAYSTVTRADDVNTALNEAANVRTNCDLSTFNFWDGSTTGTANTANCYIVTGKGSYKFPAVYGNAIQNGSALDPMPTTSTSFRNAIGNPITKAYVAADVADYASDLQVDLIKNYNSPIDPTSLSYDEDTKMISFSTADPAKQGNAIIALKGKVGGTMKVLWQWHIWVTRPDKWQTDHADIAGITSRAGNNYTFFPVELGLIYTGARKQYYDKKGTLVLAWADALGGTELTGTDAKSTSYTLVHEGSTSDTRSASYVSYRWGVPVPDKMPSSADGFTSQVIGSNGADLWSYGASVNAYNATTDMTVTKTICDPSPVGYKMAPPQAFNTLKTNDPNIAAATVNGRAQSDYIRVTKDASGNALAHNISLWKAGVWTALQNATGQGCDMRINSDNNVYFTARNSDVYHYVRPVKE